MLCVIDAFLVHGIQSSQYSHLDEILASKCAAFRRRKNQVDISDNDPLSSHQAFLLGLSDQSLVTGIGSLIALYAQMCNGLSIFSFQLGISLASFCAAVHLNTLTALRVYLRHNPRQAVVRIFLMIIFVILMLPSIALQDLLYGWSPHQLAACCIRRITALDVRSDSLTWIALTVIMAYQYFYSILSLSPPHTVEEGVQKAVRRSPFMRFIAWIPWTTTLRKDIVSAQRRRQEEIDGDNKDAVTHLRERPDPRVPKLLRNLRALNIMGPYLWRDTYNSLTVEICENSFWFAMSVMEIREQFHGHVDFGPLWSWKYGQMMPVLLLLVYLLTFVEAKSGELIKDCDHLPQAKGLNRQDCTSSIRSRAGS